ncbi:NADH-quinone oxidoreductase subunit J [Campylobacter sp. Cr9]|uniref:NADH-quinone oxidoreductase subunit J n=1 Tax=unclassified Campylobacter TaxID=2593542 RepID=UPI001EFC13D0|nr:NADH-quinone oxidoreductase subunit J [Campylobacter sp. RM5004]MBZ7985303.1 NADH-quinone oxidoreductase subunit J [Campylobacter sp. Cr9]ULO00896.1 NADH:quinone oxidoreductase I, membrane subunit J [Campylobacter sp. RM5004]
MFELFVFYVFAALVTGFFVIAVSSKNILYSLSSLACGMVLLSAHYFLLGAEFLGAAQIIVYSGAVLGLYSFAMMFFDLSKELKENLKHKKTFFTLSILASALMVIMSLGFKLNSSKSTLLVSEELENTRSLGIILFTKYLLAFEIVALILLMVIVAAIVLVAKKIKDEQ